MRIGLRALRERLRASFHLDDRPWRIALALAIGVFISCTPFYGFQTLLAIVVATVFRLNRAVTVTGAWINLPWFTPLVYAAALKVGGLVVPEPTGLGGWSLTLLLGTTLVGAGAAAVTYVVTLAILARRRARREAAGRSSGRHAA